MADGLLESFSTTAIKNVKNYFTNVNLHIDYRFSVFIALISTFGDRKTENPLGGFSSISECGKFDFYDKLNYCARIRTREIKHRVNLPTNLFLVFIRFSNNKREIFAR